MQSWLEGRNWIGKGAQATGMTASLRILSSKADSNTWESVTRSELKLESVQSLITQVTDLSSRLLMLYQEPSSDHRRHVCSNGELLLGRHGLPAVAVMSSSRRRWSRSSIVLFSATRLRAFSESFIRAEGLSLALPSSSGLSSVPEPMQLGGVRISVEERQRWILNRLCLNCGEAGHFASSCLLKARARQ